MGNHFTFAVLPVRRLLKQPWSAWNNHDGRKSWMRGVWLKRKSGRRFFFQRSNGNTKRSINAPLLVNQKGSPPLTDALTCCRAIFISIEMQMLIKCLLYGMWFSGGGVKCRKYYLLQIGVSAKREIPELRIFGKYRHI